MSEPIIEQKAPAETAAAIPSTSTTTPANTQAASTAPADIAVKKELPTEANAVTKDAVLVKKEPVSEVPAVETPEPTISKPNYAGMIQGHLDGDLEEADYEAIEAAGLSREQFIMMAEGQKALQERNTAELHGYVGGKDTYNSLKEFASVNLSEDEISAFNTALMSGIPKVAKMAVLGLKAMYESENGTRPTTRIESDGSSNAIKGYESQQDLIKDMNNKKYGKDKAYTAEVDQRRSKSGF